MKLSDKLEAGKIVNTHGLRGELKIIPWTDSPEVFEDIKRVYVIRKSGEECLDIKNIKYHKNNIIVKFEQINSIEQAEKYKNTIVLADREAFGELEEGVYFIADLIGCSVITDDGRDLGKISDVINTGSNDIYEVDKGGGKKLLLPVIDDVVKNIDIDKKIITVHLLDGLEDL
ncbi:MAG: 16S rRNA processing protein RimM [Oscillospiraceae bacterium]|nr:16S rRNA processing protein RimM [Oscillospiraceae bacterium]